MEDDNTQASYTSFLGSGWSFPPDFVAASGTVRMTRDEDDIKASLIILLGTARGERLFKPKYGLDLRQMLFEPMSTTMKTLLEDRIKTNILIYEPRINLLSLSLDTSAELEGKISILLEYEIRATNSRYNLVYPFYISDGNEVSQTVKVQAL